MFRKLTFGFAVLLSAALLCPTAWSQEGAAKPGPEHELLKKMAGDWSASAKMPGLDQPSVGVMTCKLECGGLWLVSNYESDFFGQKFQGKGLDGYDPLKKQYVGVWVDSMSAAPMHFAGDYSAKTQQLVMLCDTVSPDGKPLKIKSVTEFAGEDKHTFTMYALKGDQADLMMTIEYTRKK